MPEYGRIVRFCGREVEILDFLRHFRLVEFRHLSGGLTIGADVSTGRVVLHEDFKQFFVAFLAEHIVILEQHDEIHHRVLCLLGVETRRRIGSRNLPLYRSVQSADLLHDVHFLREHFPCSDIGAVHGYLLREFVVGPFFDKNDAVRFDVFACEILNVHIVGYALLRNHQQPFCRGSDDEIQKGQ